MTSYSYNPTDDNKEIFNRIHNLEARVKLIEGDLTQMLTLLVDNAKVLYELNNKINKKADAPIPFVKPNWMKYET